MKKSWSWFDSQKIREIDCTKKKGKKSLNSLNVRKLNWLYQKQPHLFHDKMPQKGEKTYWIDKKKFVKLAVLFTIVQNHHWFHGKSYKEI